MVLISSMHHNATMLNATSHWPRGCFCSLPPSVHFTPIQIDLGYMGQNTFLIFVSLSNSTSTVWYFHSSRGHSGQFSKWPGYQCLNVIYNSHYGNMGCRQCLPLSVVQLKGKHCRKPHCRIGVVDTFGHWVCTGRVYYTTKI